VARLRASLAVCVLVCAAAAGSANAAIPPLWKNCSHVNKRYLHGVSKVGAPIRRPATR
jgi:hypothetical protein